MDKITVSFGHENATQKLPETHTFENLKWSKKSSMRENSRSNLDFNKSEDYIYMHNEICSSGKYNFEGCNFPLKF